MNQINTVTIGKLIEAHREGDEQKFKTYVDFIVKAYEEQENDRAARIIRSSYTGDYGEQGKVVLDEAGEQTVYYETGWYEPEILGSGGSYRGIAKTSSEEEAHKQFKEEAKTYRKSYGADNITTEECYRDLYIKGPDFTDWWTVVEVPTAEEEDE